MADFTIIADGTTINPTSSCPAGFTEGAPMEIENNAATVTVTWSSSTNSDSNEIRHGAGVKDLPSGLTASQMAGSALSTTYPNPAQSCPVLITRQFNINSAGYLFLMGGFASDNQLLAAPVGYALIRFQNHQEVQSTVSVTLDGQPDSTLFGNPTFVVPANGGVGMPVGSSGTNGNTYVLEATSSAGSGNEFTAKKNGSIRVGSTTGRG